MAEGFQQLDVLSIEPIAVTRFSGMVRKSFGIHRLVAPVDGVNIIPFDLMGSCCAAPDEIFREHDGGVVVQIKHSGSFCSVVSDG